MSDAVSDIPHIGQPNSTKMKIITAQCGPGHYNSCQYQLPLGSIKLILFMIFLQAWTVIDNSMCLSVGSFKMKTSCPVTLRSYWALAQLTDKTDPMYIIPKLSF